MVGFGKICPIRPSSSYMNFMCNDKNPYQERTKVEWNKQSLLIIVYRVIVIELLVIIHIQPKYATAVNPFILLLILALNKENTQNGQEKTKTQDCAKENPTPITTTTTTTTTSGTRIRKTTTVTTTA